MKKLLLLAVIASSYCAFGQRLNSLQPANDLQLTSRTQLGATTSQVKTLNCIDTLRYPQAKQQILGANSAWLFDIWNADNEAISQTFLNSGPLTISGVEFLGMNNATDGTPSVTVRASIYNVNASNVPTTLITSGDVTLTSTTAAYRYVNFTPVVVSGNYAVVIDVISANGIFTCYINNPAPGQTYDEDFSRIKSSYYPQSNGAFVSVPVLTTDAVNFASGPYNFEAMVAPMVSYMINTDFTVNTTPSCLGTPVTFTNTTTPAGIFDSRMNNFQKFEAFFQGAVTDSTFVYEMNPTTLVWQANHSYTYGTAATHNPTLYTLGGFWTSCTDFKTTPVVVNPVDNSSFSFSGSTLCSGTGTETPTVSLAGGTFTSSPAGLTINASTGEVDLVASTEGTYTVTYTTAGTCPSSTNNPLTLTSAPDASFTFAQAAFCSADTDPTPVFGAGASSGAFSSTTGLVINGANGIVDLSASTAGTYTVTNTIAASGACPSATETFDISIATTPTATVSGGGDFCGTGTLPVNIALTGAGPWDVIYSDGTNTTTESGVAASPFVINASANGTYTVTSVTSGTCSSTGVGTASVTFNPIPAVTLASFSGMCVDHAPLTLTGGLPAGGAYSGVGVAGGIFNPTTAGAGTHTITYEYEDGNNCSADATQTIIVDACAAINELNNLNIVVAPNPANDIVTINFNGGKDLSYYVISEDGKIVINAKVITAGSESFSVKTFAQGMYFVHLSNEDGTTVKKIVVQ